MSRDGTFNQIYLRDEDISRIETEDGKFVSGVRYENKFYRLCTIRLRTKTKSIEDATRRLARKIRRKLLKLEGDGCLGVLEAPRCFPSRGFLDVVAIVVPLPREFHLERVERQSLEEFMEVTRREVLG